jgi:hypothetical protein
VKEDISMREIIRIIWQGRYIVLIVTLGAIAIALLSSLFLTKPLYEAKAVLNVSIYGTENTELIEIIEKTKLLEYALKDLVSDPRSYEPELELKGLNEPAIEVTFRANERDFANQAVKQIAQRMHELLNDYVIEYFAWEREYLEFEIEIADKKLDAYFKEFNRSLKERLLLQEKNLEYKSQLLDEYIAEIYGVLSLDQHDSKLTSDPVYIALFNRKVQTMAELIETRLHLDQFRQGDISEDILMDDPIYNRLIENKINLDLLLFDFVFHIGKLEELRDLGNTEDYIDIIPADTRPLVLPWKRDTLFAGVIGLMLSVVVIFIKIYVVEFTMGLKRSQD